MSAPESLRGALGGRDARWFRAFAEDAAERLSGRLGPCHGCGGVGHRCNGPSSWRTVSTDKGLTEPYRWCDRAAHEFRRDAKASGVAAHVCDELRCPDCGGEPCNGGRELVPTFKLIAGVMSPAAGTDICEHDCHDHDREENDDDRG